MAPVVDRIQLEYAGKLRVLRIDVNDPESQVAQLKKGNRNYGLLEELQTRPRTTYLAAVRNLNPEMPAGAARG